MKPPRPSLLVLLRFLAILGAAFFIILALHVEPAQGGRLRSSPPSPVPHTNPSSECGCNNGT
ncbi:hypothetical protein BDA96_08G064500 [Sorghum bicolor]|uniref:Uncharacterized protein n=2 Tax=Sorghum bicolor TaxID=4558 RepID=A0A921QDY7_SORBI|nr:hypothetical protein BDA96_08G064500 [Sorghum bicolor]OQU78844.1 hypothetical protein SORBI_3008G060050 [Sorghum bicolor]